MALIVSLPIGTPPQTQQMVLDTGSFSPGFSAITRLLRSLLLQRRLILLSPLPSPFYHALTLFVSREFSILPSLLLATRTVYDFMPLFLLLR